MAEQLEGTDPDLVEVREPTAVSVVVHVLSQLQFAIPLPLASVRSC